MADRWRNAVFTVTIVHGDLEEPTGFKPYGPFMDELADLGKPIDWADKHVDLLVIDEASQVSLPAAVLAGAPLREDGQALIVGDHRQMPPILVHDWENEPRRVAQESQVYRSTFESLLARGFTSPGLDRSFRLHAMRAEFLENHVYRKDRVGSTRTCSTRSPTSRGSAATSRRPSRPSAPS